MLSRASSSHAHGGTLVYLNVYDLTPFNGYVYWFGLGVYHSAIEAYGVEFAFGAHDYSTSGVFEVEPRSCPGFTFRRSILLGTIYLGPKEFREFIEQMASEYHGDSYHLIARNCNHFCDDICMRLTGCSIPGWVNRLARLGSLCNCLLPVGLQVNARQHTLGYTGYECQEKSFRGTCCRLAGTATVAPRKRHHSVSSVFLHSSIKGEVTRWDWKNLNIFKGRLRHL